MQDIVGKRGADMIRGIFGYDVWNCLKHRAGQQVDGGIGIWLLMALTYDGEV